MLFPYTYVPHSMEKMQKYIDYIFNDVWCMAKGKDYNVELLFAGNDELKQIITELHTSDLIGADFFLTGLQKVFEDFKTLSEDDIKKVKQWYKSNNSIEKLCANDPSVTPATYKTITILSSDLGKHLKKFFKNLYSNSFLSLKSISDRIGTIDGHYHAFMKENRTGKCPFCGIHDIKGIYHSKREAYDHFLPKGKYPFNSINFYNLVPACHECNSTYKLSIDPLHNVKDPLQAGEKPRRKSFYPYSVKSYKIELNVELNCSDWTTIKPEDIEIITGPDRFKNEITTWLDLYGIEERYMAKCCGENDGKGWIREIVDESQNYGLTPSRYLQGKIQTAKNEPWVDDNFLKRPFLEACQRAGLLNVVR